jgi:[acyl-carrier-protein] S-malonyltransferase
MYSPVKWQQSVEQMAEQVDHFIEVGPGKVLSGFIKKIAKSKLLGNVEDPTGVDKVLTRIKEVSHE